MIPETQYARHDGLHLAYQVLGNDPPDILFLDQWFGHLEAQWDVAPLADLRECLASFGRLINQTTGARRADHVLSWAPP